MDKDEALRLALKALEGGVKTQANGLDWIEYDSELVEKAITAIKDALEANDEIVQWKMGASGIGGTGVIVQPQRTWVGLTDEEILAKCESVPDYDIGNHDLIHFARAIEAELRSKHD
jgi:hypothetical protein